MFAVALRPDQRILAAAGVLLAGACGVGVFIPPLFSLTLAAATGAGAVFLAFCSPNSVCAGWLLITGMTLEMTLHDLIGGDAYQSTIALAKGVEIGLGFLAMVRFGPVLDPLCPAWAFLAMTAAGLAHGLYPGLSATDSIRSMIGSVAPFAFCFARLPRCWAETMIHTAKWCPVIAVTAGVPLAALGIRPLFVDSGGARLAGLGHPAFLAGVCLPAIYACLIQLYRQGRSGDLMLLIANFLILGLTGARAPIAYAVAVTGISLVSIRSCIFAPQARLVLVLAALAGLLALALLAGDLNEVRLFNVVLHETTNLSGRQLIWPEFANASAASPWFGWGVGAGNLIVPPSSRIAQILHTWAPHNEYLRIQVEGGWLGEGLLIILFAAWGISRTRRLVSSDRRIMRLGFLALAAHMLTDNVLISTPACVMFAFAAAVFARGAAE